GHGGRGRYHGRQPQSPPRERNRDRPYHAAPGGEPERASARARQGARGGAPPAEGSHAPQHMRALLRTGGRSSSTPASGEDVTVLLKGKSCVVTGAGGFIGLALCGRLVVEGAQVTGIDVDPAADARVAATGAVFRD